MFSTFPLPGKMFIGDDSGIGFDICTRALLLAERASLLLQIVEQGLSNTKKLFNMHLKLSTCALEILNMLLNMH